jgi:hypothetical protein
MSSGRKIFPEVDQYADDMEVLKISREKIISLADYVVPGHDDIYKLEI